MLPRSLLLVLALPCALAGCGTPISAPSLGPRAVEKQPIDLPVADAREVETPADQALVARIAGVIARAEDADRAFAAQRTRTEAVIARASGAAAGSEPWIAAQEALTALESLRAPLRDTAGSVDELRDDPANAATGNRAAIDAAAARISELDAAEGAAVAGLSARLR